MQKVIPFLWYNDKAGEAVSLYKSVLPELEVLSEDPMSTTFRIGGQEYIAFNGGPHFRFTEAFSLMVLCDTQEEIDEKWNALTANGGAESRCGWLKDPYGMSWQIIPSFLQKYLSDPDREKADRAMQAMLKMNKIIITDLDAAYHGK